MRFPYYLDLIASVQEEFIESKMGRIAVPCTHFGGAEFPIPLQADENIVSECV